MKHTVALLVLLHKPSRASAVSDPPGCADGHAPINCDDGHEVGSRYQGLRKSCEAACTSAGGSCCNGYFACFGFTGLVCPDGSCSGDGYSCYRANIDLVVNGCKGDNRTCFFAEIDLVHDGCVGNYACSWAGNGGYVGMIIDACKGESACEYAGEIGGSIGSINNSCNNDDACLYALRANTTEVGAPAIVDCCNDVSECRDITELPDFCISAAPSVSTAPSASANPSVTGLPTVTSKPSASANPSVTPTKAGKSAKSSKATKKGNVANEIIKDGLNFQGIEFSMMAGDESLSYDQSVDVGLLSFDFSEEEEEFEDNNIDEDEDVFALSESPFHKRKE